jgi:kynureninase
VIDRDEALARDAADELAPWRERFVIPDPGLVYLDGNSLGMAPRAVVDAVVDVMQGDWAGGLIRSWDHWVDLPQRVGATLAPLLGVDGDEVIVHDSTTINLYQLVHAALALRPDRGVIAIEDTDFSTNRYAVAGIGAATGHEVRHDVERLDDVAVVVRSLVDYRTAAIVDLAGETTRATAAGALVIWDLSHAIGLLELDLHRAGVELAVGCTYKFLGAGPGAPGWSYVTRSLQSRIEQPLWGWFGQEEQFAMGPSYVPRDDIGRLLVGTPGILGLAAVQAGAELVAAAGIGAIRHKATALTGFALELCDQWGLASPTPRNPECRGGHVSVRHPDAAALTRQLAHRGVITDHRPPDLVRLGCAPLTTRFTDVYDGLAALADLA